MPLQDLAGPATGRSPHRRGWSAAPWIGVAALSIAALATANALLARRSEARHPPDGRFLKVDGLRLHYREAGRGPAIVLLHGNGVSSEDFLVSGLMGRLARVGRVIAFDRPGFGYSDRPRERDWAPPRQAELFWKALGQLGIEQPILVGHSWGAFVASEMALSIPTSVAGLVLISGYYRPTARVDALLMAGPSLPLVGDVLRYTLSPLAGRLMAPAILRHLFAPAPVTDRFERLYPVSQSLRPSQLRASAAEAGMIMPAAAELAPRLPGLPTRTLIIAGAQDRLLDTDHQSGWLASQAPHADYLPIGGAGHMVHHTAADKVADAVSKLVVAPSPSHAAQSDRTCETLV
jgi:pimeloyl-ACP methyl ester carboxylesterase